MSVTLIAVAPLITWLLVSTRPLADSTMPVPAEVAPWSPSVDTTSTSAGSTREAISLEDSAVLDVAVTVPATPWFMLPTNPPSAAPAASATAPVAISPRLRLRFGGIGGTPP